VTTLKLNKLAEFREQRLMSRAELARKAEISPLTILKIENGQRCRPETARKIIVGLGYTMDDKDSLFQEIIGPNSAATDEEIDKECVKPPTKPKAKAKARSKG
jgi:DNA-binding XRE family transcriptional regulator